MPYKNATPIIPQKIEDFAELVCSNSLRAAGIKNAVGLLKEEMRRLGSLCLQSADKSSVAAGVRRIEAVTGAGLLDLLNEKDALIADVARELKCQNPSDIGAKAAALSAELASARREIESLNSKLAATKLDSILSATKQVGSVKLAAVRFDGMAIEIARSLADEIKANNPDTVAVIAVNGEKLNFIAVCGADAAKAGAHAGKLVSAVAAVTGGKGGGRPDNAMAGGADTSKIDEALALAEATLAGMLK